MQMVRTRPPGGDLKTAAVLEVVRRCTGRRPAGKHGPDLNQVLDFLGRVVEVDTDF